MKLAASASLTIVLLIACGGDDGGATATGGGAGAGGTGGVSGAGGVPDGGDPDAGVPCADTGTPPGPPAGARFEDLTETQMFGVTRDVLCETLIRCPVVAEGEIYTPTRCVQEFNDMRYYANPIDAPSRVSLDACLDEMQLSGCCDLLSAFPMPCDLAQDLLDLK